jgi:hypothetical protein
MADYLRDPTIWVYLVTLLIAFYGAGLFSWWWIKKGRASSVFAYVTFIFLGEIMESGMSLYARVLRIGYGQSAHEAFTSCALWPTRKLVTILALAFIVTHMSYRAFRKLPAGENRRETD